MSKPDNLYEWATDPDATFEPSSDLKAAGHVTGERPPPRVHNWLWNGAHRWIKYLDKLHEEAQFLNKAYHFTNTFEVDGETTLNDAVSVTAGGVEVSGGGLLVSSGGVVVSGAGDVLIASGGSLLVDTAQVFTNVTLNGSSSEALYADASGTPTPRAHTVLVPLEDGALFDSPADSASIALGGEWDVPLGQLAKLSFPLRIPHGGTLVSVRAGLKNTSLVNPCDMQCQIFLRTPDKTVPGNTTWSDVSTGDAAVAVAADTDHIATATCFFGALDTSTASLVAVFNLEEKAHLYWLEMTFLDPGPRNF